MTAPMDRHRLARLRRWAASAHSEVGHWVRELLDEVDRLRAAETDQMHEHLHGLARELLSEITGLRDAVTHGRPHPTPTGQPSRSELTALVGVALGESVQDTARRLCLSVNTVKKQRADAYRRLNARTGAHAVALAMTAGLITADHLKPWDESAGGDA